MKAYRDGILGPDLNTCDIVSYDFGDAQIQFRLPNDPNAGESFLQAQDIVEDWRNCSSHVHLVKSEWDLKEDVNGLLRVIGLVRLEMDFFSFDKVPLEKAWKKTGLYSFVKKSDLSQMAIDFFVDLIWLWEEMDIPGISQQDALREWEVFTDPSLLPIVKQDILPWYMNRRRKQTNSYTWESIIIIPVSDRSVIIAKFDSEILIYDGEEYIIPKSEHAAFDEELRKEFFSHFNVKYSAEILAKIKDAENQ